MLLSFGPRSRRARLIVRQYTVTFTSGALRITAFVITVCGAFALASQGTSLEPLTARGKIVLYPTPTELTLDLQIESGFYAYIDQFKLKLRNQPNLTVVGFDLSPIHKFNDKFSKKMRFGVKDKATLRSPLVWTPSKGQMQVEQPVVLELTYQACNKEICLYPRALVVELKPR